MFLSITLSRPVCWNLVTTEEESWDHRHGQDSDDSEPGPFVCEVERQSETGTLPNEDGRIVGIPVDKPGLPMGLILEFGKLLDGHVARLHEGCIDQQGYAVSETGCQDAGAFANLRRGGAAVTKD
jgi:hypothetical protein